MLGAGGEHIGASSPLLWNLRVHRKRNRPRATRTRKAAVPRARRYETSLFRYSVTHIRTLTPDRRLRSVAPRKTGQVSQNALQYLVSCIMSVHDVIGAHVTDKYNLTGAFISVHRQGVALTARVKYCTCLL